MKHPINRREFLKQTAVSGAGLWLGSQGLARAQSPNEKLNIAVVGVGGQGGGNLSRVASQNIVALCDIDDRILAQAAQRFPMAKTYTDYRRLLDQKGIDAVVVSTPDHHHALVTLRALDEGRHVYCEKPLTHSAHEAREVAKMAARRKLATQMGNQAHSSDGSRRQVELIRSGAIGPVREIHAWTDRPIWPQGLDRPTDTPPVPENIHWEQWLGPAPERPYNPVYLPFKWRGWWDFGTGAVGDMACHILDVAFWALEPGHPSTIEAEGPPPHPETAPKWMIARYEFPDVGERPPLKLTWYEGGKLPPAELVEGGQFGDNGLLLVGDKGRLLLPHGGGHRLFPVSDFSGFKPPEPSIPSSPGHHEEWIQACKTGSATGSNFAFATHLTEVVLLANVAYRAGEKLQWDGKSLKAKNCPKAEEFVRLRYRKGWSLKG